MTFTPDSPLVSQVLPQPNHSGVSTKRYITVHSIECPPGKGWAEALGGTAYLQNPAEQHSVHYVLDADSIIQGLPESLWAWHVGTPGSAPGIAIEQAGYAAFTKAQWLGTPAAVGSSYVRPNGQTVTYSQQDADDMGAQFILLARLVSDIIERHGWNYAWATPSQVQDMVNGADLGVHTWHHLITDSVGGTVHVDPNQNGPAFGDNYPLAELMAAAQLVVTPTPPVSGDDEVTPQDKQDIIDGVLDAHLPTDGHGGYTTLRKGFPILKSDAHATLGVVSSIKTTVASLATAITASVSRLVGR